MLRSSLLVALLVLPCPCFAQLPPGVVDTQTNGDTPPTPNESFAKITVPNGFHVTLFAGEPDVHQPIDMTIDDRGRLWVVECFAYPDWAAQDSDRILIFEDTDNDGQFDTRKVFADGLNNLTGIAIGFGGVWACSTPELIFIPDRNRDDQPDGPAEVKLDGWNDLSNDVKHNVFNGLVWGPDGWMYGGHGILGDSMIGKPGDAAEQRHRMNCGIWRFHPVTEEFEIVAHGTTNPWGIDFDEMGQGFFTNSVIGHLWHLIPGASYERMYGTHFNPHTYTLIDQCADHLHWGEGRWTDSRGGVGIHSEAGGGHAHAGAMIYRGGTWPAEYHGSLFTCNLHGNRLNRDRLRRSGSGYVATHGPDFLHGNDPWFRGIDLLYGPDGNVFVSDWTDLGECHDNDGTHRSSGRIYKIAYGDAQPARELDLFILPNEELLEFVDDSNAWYWNHARRILHERASDGLDMQELCAAVRKRLATERNTSTRLKLLDALALSGGMQTEGLQKLLRDGDEFIQSWAVRKLAESGTEYALEEISDIVPTATPRLLLEMASALQRLPMEQRWLPAASLMMHFPEAGDHNLLAMLWYAIEPLAVADREQFAALPGVGNTNPQLAPLRRFIARRVLADDPTDTEEIDKLLKVVEQLPREAQIDVLGGINTALAGEPSVSIPSRWANVVARIGDSASPDGMRVVDELSIKFHDTTTINRIKTTAMNRATDAEERTAAITMLVQNDVDGSLGILSTLLNDQAVRKSAIRLLEQFNEPAVPRLLLSRFSSFNQQEQQLAISTLASSRQHARALMEAVASGLVPAKVIKPAQAAEIYQLRDGQLRKLLGEHWGDLRATPREKRNKILTWKAQLDHDTLAEADLKNGAKVYADNCGKCHRLFGKGGDIGPDLTGSDRRNLDYILENVITPSAVVGKDFRLHSVVLLDGRVVTGALREQTPSAIVVQTVDNRVTVPRSQIDVIEKTDLSLMPEGQFDAMPKDFVRDVVAYLASDPE